MEVLLYLANTICYAGQSATGKLYAAKGGQAYIFNFSKALSAAALFLVWCILKGSRFHFPTFLYSILYGLFLTMSMHFGFLALSTGAMALTGMVAAMSLLIPLFWGLLFWEETLVITAIIGIVLLLFAIGFICSPRKEKISRKWVFYSLMTLLCNGFCSVVQKYHQRDFPGYFQVEFMLYAMITATVILLIFLLLRKQIPYRLTGLGSLSGTMNGLANFIVLLLAATENASSLFPLISAGNVMTAYLTGLFFFHEKIRPHQILGLLAGAAGIILLKF